MLFQSIMTRTIWTLQVHVTQQLQGFQLLTDFNIEKGEFSA